MFPTVPPISRFSLGRDRPILGMIALTEECCYKMLREHFLGRRLSVFASRIQVDNKGKAWLLRKGERRLKMEACAATQVVTQHGSTGWTG